MSQGQVAWMRRWYFDGEQPKKERNENGRMAWPAKFKFLPVTPNKCFDDDVPLFANEPVVPSDELATALDAMHTDAEECLDFDECTAMLVPMDNWNAVFEALSKTRGQ